MAGTLNARRNSPWAVHGPSAWCRRIVALSRRPTATAGRQEFRRNGQKACDDRLSRHTTYLGRSECVIGAIGAETDAMYQKRTIEAACQRDPHQREFGQVLPALGHRHRHARRGDDRRRGRHHRRHIVGLCVEGRGSTRPGSPVVSMAGEGGDNISHQDEDDAREHALGAVGDATLIAQGSEKNMGEQHFSWILPSTRGQRMSYRPVSRVEGRRQVQDGERERHCIAA